MKRARNYELLSTMLILLLLFSCREKSIPRPRSYFRIEFPEKQYTYFDTICPFTFEYPAYGKISYDINGKVEPCWFNLEFPQYKATIHFSYKQINGNLAVILKESNEYVYTHTIKADAITEQPWFNKEKKVYGILYDIKGNTASSVQFFLTDSTKHFLRGALYFYVQPSEDSLAPVISFFREDIVHLIESFQWKSEG